VQEINDGTRKIITVEDPIEYRVTGLSQIKMDHARNVTYSSVLHGVLRHDPDVILIGECRDLDAAEIAVEASMTGHLVLTTMHTNNAVAAILRLMNIGVSAIDVSNSLSAAYAQRLIPRLCPKCKVKAETPSAMIKSMGKKAPAQIYAAKGCPECNGTGYKGRLPVAELLPIDDDIRDVIIASPSLSALNKVAQNKGLRTMMDYGLELVAEGELQYTDVMHSVI
jgi:type II secretory ATPase GspE/PulE/Tfp pilus assembly ATPase PilB-like protein